MFYIQLIGLLAFLVLVLSFYKKTTTEILTYQITSNFAYSVHYFLLGGISGALTSMVGIFRNITVLKSKNNKALIGLIYVIAYLIITAIFYDEFYSVFPMCANISYLISMLREDKKTLLIGGIFNSMFWLLYAIFVTSYVCMITETILIISNTIQLRRLK